jgi:hypothetical protein
MPTEVFRIADSQDIDDNGGYTGERVARSFQGGDAYAVAMGVYSALTLAGWQAAGGSKATFSLVLPFGLPVTDPPVPPLGSKPTVQSGPNPCSIDGTPLYFYDPTRVDPDLTLTDVEWIATGATTLDSILALAGAVESFGWVYTGYHHDDTYPYVGWLHLDFEAPDAGLEWNGTVYGGPKVVTGGVTSNWYWGMISATGLAGGPHGNAPAGGSYTLRSYQSPTSYFETDIAIPRTGSPDATFTFRTSADVASPYTIALGANYSEVDPDDEDGGLYPFRIVANQFQFYLWLTGPVSTAYIAVRQLFALFPKLATDHGLTSAGIVGVGFRHQAEWYASAAANSGFTRQIGTYDHIGLKPCWCCMRFTGVEITDSIGRPIAQTAYVTAPPDGAPNTIAGQARIVGLAWDAILVSALYDLGDRQRFLSRDWECVGRYDGEGTQLTFWLIVPADDTPE